MKNQIDYQTLDVALNNSSEITKFNIPLPINSILKGVTLEKYYKGNTVTGDAVQCRVMLVQEDGNSNIRLNHELMSGVIYYSWGGSSSFPVKNYDKNLSGLFDIPIQKEGISIQVIFYNVSGLSSRAKIHTIVKNLEGGI